MGRKILYRKIQPTRCDYVGPESLDETMNLAEKSSKRPLSVTVAIGILIFNAVLMLIWWAVQPDQIVSNGSQVFFVTLWLMMAGLLYIGSGWVRYASIVLALLFVFAWYNTGDTNTDNIGTISAKVLAVIATALLFLPQSHRWFRWVYRTELEKEREEADKRKAQAS